MMKTIKFYPCILVSVVINFSASGGVPRNWYVRSAPVTNHLNGVTSGNDAFFAVGSKAVVLRSTNGIDWDPLTTPTGNADLFSAAYGKDYLVTGGERDWLFRSFEGGTNSAHGLGTTFGHKVYGLTFHSEPSLFERFVGVGTGAQPGI